jgi:glutathione S-transferase
MSETTTLFTFPPSLDSELARFLLTHYGVEHRERPHVIIFSSFVSLWHGFTLRFPLVTGRALRLIRVRDVVDHFEPLCPADRRLLPDPGARQAADEDWQLFNGTLAFATATFGYYHLLRHRHIMIGPLSRGAPRWEVRAVRLAYPIFAGLLRLMLRLSAGRAATALETVRGLMNKVAARLADGRAYLGRDHLSLSDVAFAVALAPLLLPEHYGGALPGLAEMPEPVAQVIREVREHPAGRHALRIYRDHRRGEAR